MIITAGNNQCRASDIAQFAAAVKIQDRMSISQKPVIVSWFRYSGNPALRKACFEVMQALKLTKPQDDPVYLFLLKKEQEGKPYNVAKMAAVNKFLRIYYARAMELYK